MKIARFEDDKMVTYNFSSLEDLRNKVEDWKKEFREVNKTDKIIGLFGRDRTYEEYCKELNGFISKYAEG